MNRAGSIITAILMWCAITAYIVVAGSHARERRSDIAVVALHIDVDDTTRMVTVGKVLRWLAEEGIAPIGYRIDSVDTRFIESRLSARPEVKHVSAWTDLSGTLRVKVEGRTPAMRVRTSGGYRFWFTDDGVIVPDRSDFAAYVPIVTGSIPFPFAPASEGSYGRMKADVYDDYYERFSAIDAERKELSTRLAVIRAEIRTVRASSPKRLWSKARDSVFYVKKNQRLAELDAQRVENIAALDKIDKIERSVREKEKKSYQSYRFLSKLANFVGFIGRDRFWTAQIVQINVVDGTGHGGERGGGHNGRDEWREPQLELVPRAGDHVILLGELDGTERQRLENLRLFYREGLWHEGWEEYGYINIKYGNQIVCTK